MPKGSARCLRDAHGAAARPLAALRHIVRYRGALHTPRRSLKRRPFREASMSVLKRLSLVRAGLGLAALAAAMALTPAAHAQQQKVLRAVLHADVRTLDPFWTTQTIAGIHGMLVYDTLFGSDDKLVPQPQMVGKYEVSADKLTYTFTLRDGLKFHDGS